MKRNPRSTLMLALVLAASGACASTGDPVLREALAARSVARIHVGAVRNVGPPVRLPPEGIFVAIFAGGERPSEEARAIAATTRAAERALRQRGWSGGGGPDSREATLEIDLLAFDARRLPDRRSMRIGARFRLVDPADGKVLDEREARTKEVTGVQPARADDFEEYLEVYFRRALAFLPESEAVADR